MQPANTPAFTLRPPTFADLPAVVAMLNACWLDTAGTAAFSEAGLRAHWSQPGRDYSQDVCLAVDASGVLGYCAATCHPPYVNNFLLVCTHPAHRGRGIGTVLTAWGEQRCAECLPFAPPDAQVTVGCNNFGAHQAGAQLLHALGYQHVRSGYEMKIEMASPPPQPQWPAGIHVRSMVANQEEADVFRCIEEAFRDHWGHVAKPFEEGFAQWLHGIRNVPDYTPDFFFLALDGDQIAGLALGFPKDNEYPDMCWVQSLGVRRPWRRRGLALALLHHIFGECYRRGIYKVGLGVDAASLTNATRLYERAGMQIFRQWDNYEKILRAGKDLVTRALEG